MSLNDETVLEKNAERAQVIVSNLTKYIILLIE